MKKATANLIICILLYSVYGGTVQLKGQVSPQTGQYFENITLYTDRDIYISGENIWFHAYCSDDHGNSDSILSRILYVEMYDQRLNPVVRNKFRLVNGLAEGHFTIPADIKTGSYIIRAYTQYLRNFSPYTWPTSFVAVINPQKPLSTEEITPRDEVLIAPEGGRLVAGIPSRLAVRLHPALSREVESISVEDENGNKISSKLPYLNGLCMLEMTPVAGTAYSLNIRLRDGEMINKRIVPVSESGVILKAIQTGDNMAITLFASGADPNDSEYFIEIRSKSFENLISRPLLPGESFMFSTAALDEIVYLVLKNNENEILDIQSKYLTKPGKQKITLSGNKGEYTTREEVKLDMDLPGSLLQNGHILVTATPAGLHGDENLVPFPVAYNPALLSNFIHSSAIEADSLKFQLDILMILYSALYAERDFKESIMRNDKLTWLPEIRDAGISGQVLDRMSGKPLKDITVYAAVIDGNNQIHIYRTGADGRFYFTLNHLNGLKNVFICPQENDSMDMELLIEADFSDEYASTTGIIPFGPDSSYLGLITRLFRNARINNSYEKYSEKAIEDPVYYPLTQTGPEYSIILKDFIEMPVMSEIFTEIVPFVTLRKKDDNYFLNLFDDKTQATYTDPLLLLDGIPVLDHGLIMDVSPELIEKVTVTNKICYLGDFTMNGMISVTTTTNDFAGIKMPRSSRFIEFQALNPESSPLFPAHVADVKDRNPDFRNLLYWNSGTSGSPKNSIRFYTSDATGDYEVTVRATDGIRHYTGKTLIRVRIR